MSAEKTMHWAESYIGKPWVNGGDTPAGYDCFGLVRAVYADRLSITIPEVDVDALQPLAICRAMRSYDYGEWETVSTPSQNFDVVEMSQATRPHHLGIYVDGGVLSSVEGAGVIYQRLHSLKRHGWNIVACYRRKSQ